MYEANSLKRDKQYRKGKLYEKIKVCFQSIIDFPVYNGNKLVLCKGYLIYVIEKNLLK